MKRIVIAAVAALVVLPLASCGEEKAPEVCVTALNQADDILRNFSKSADAIVRLDETTFKEAMSNVHELTPKYRENNEKCKSLKS